MTTSLLSRRNRRQFAWAVVAVLAIGNALFAVFPYLTGNPAASRIPLNPNISLHYLSIVAHALPASLLLFVGPFEFSTKLRARRPALHRTLGYVYVVSVVFAALAAIAASTFSVDGISVQIAFYLLSAAWLFTVVQGYRTIKQGQIQLHRIWMIRNYALSFAAVSLRALLGLGVALQKPFPALTFNDIYTTSAWASFVLCAVVAEYFIIHKTLAPLVRKRGNVMRAPALADQ